MQMAAGVETMKVGPSVPQDPSTALSRGKAAVVARMLTDKKEGRRPPWSYALSVGGTPSLLELALPVELELHPSRCDATSRPVCRSHDYLQNLRGRQ